MLTQCTVRAEILARKLFGVLSINYIHLARIKFDEMQCIRALHLATKGKTINVMMKTSTNLKFKTKLWCVLEHVLYTIPVTPSFSCAVASGTSTTVLPKCNTTHVHMSQFDRDGVVSGVWEPFLRVFTLHNVR